ncbi:MAG: hypothetical protein H6811_11745 [Phycisphaeraceae bacterium]|nr:hypothetical protein [Phycisphaeraceae bacterium]
MNPIEPSIPFHIARAYEVPVVSPVRPVANVSAARPSVIRTQDGQIRIRPLVPESSDGIGRLVAAGVPGKVSFSEDGSAAPSLSLYRHPAERNAAATGVDLGKRLDVTA